MTSATVGRTQIEIDGAGSAIVFVHGLGGTSNSFQMLLGALGGFRCIRPDLPGSGRSPHPIAPLSIDMFVETIAEIIEKLGGGAVHLVGHSMGALICQHVAARHPECVKSLSLFGPIVEPSESARQRLKDRARTARQDGMIDIADAVATGGNIVHVAQRRPAARALHPRKPYAPGSRRFRANLRGARGRARRGPSISALPHVDRDRRRRQCRSPRARRARWLTG